MTLFDNLYRTLHDNNRPLMNFIVHHSQYKHECDIEQQQQRDEAHAYSSSKASERHTDNSLLGSVRRRLIAPKLRIQNSTSDNGKSSATAASTPTSNSTNDARSKTRSMTMDLRRSASRESISNNNHIVSNGMNTGRMTSFFSSSKVSGRVLLV